MKMRSNVRSLFGGLILAAWAATGGVIGCGGAGGSRDRSAVTARAAAVVVTYYYLPG